MFKLITTFTFYIGSVEQNTLIEHTLTGSSAQALMIAKYLSGINGFPNKMLSLTGACCIQAS